MRFATPWSPTAPRMIRLLGCLAALGLLAGACGNEPGQQHAGLNAESLTTESGLKEAGSPIRGGRIVYGMEAETTGGWCLPEAELAPSGNLVRMALYDSLTAFNDKTEVKPYLAKSVVPDDTNSRWTIVLRDSVKFHDGSDLDATVVKNNLDAYLGKYPGRAADLFPIVLANVDTVKVKDTLTLEVTTKVPWIAFPSYLTNLGIMRQAQLDDKDCERNMIGTGPFELAEWIPNQKLLAQRNPDYWQIAPDGDPYPYAETSKLAAATRSGERALHPDGSALHPHGSVPS